MKDAPSRSKNEKPKIPVAKYGTLAALLNIDVSDPAPEMPPEEGNALLESYASDPDAFMAELLGDLIPSA